jgi:1D-myo-inositol 3-kinase
MNATLPGAPAPFAPHLLVIGHVTRDESPDGDRLGGAGSYAALAGARLGVPTALVTVAPPDDPLLEGLTGVPNLRVNLVPDPVMTTFALDYSGSTRQLFLRRRARALRPEDVPDSFRAASVAYVGPVAAECDRALVASLKATFVGAGLQGWLRRAEPDGRIVPALLPEALDPPRLGCAILSVEDHPEVNAIAARFASAGATVAITRGARGSTLLSAGEPLDIPAAPAREIDPTGAGDVFGVVLTLQLAAGASLQAAATTAATAAARVVEGPGLGRL